MVLNVLPTPVFVSVLETKCQWYDSVVWDEDFVKYSFVQLYLLELLGQVLDMVDLLLMSMNKDEHNLNSLSVIELK